MREEEREGQGRNANCYKGKMIAKGQGREHGVTKEMEREQKVKEKKQTLATKEEDTA